MRFRGQGHAVNGELELELLWMSLSLRPTGQYLLCAGHGSGHSPCPRGGDRHTLDGLAVCLHQGFVRKHVPEEVALFQDLDEQQGLGSGRYGASILRWLTA